MIYDYDTPNISWQITEGADGIARLYRFVTGDNPPFGGWLVYHSDHYSCAEAETSADASDEEEFPVSPDVEPIPLVREPAAPPFRKVA